MSELQNLARSAALETAPRDAVGGFIERIDEGDSVYTYLFESKLKGYRDWRWAVVLHAPDGQQATVSEVLLLPGETSLIAPDWVPWSERLADYRALQAELEAQAALEAEEAEEAEDSEDIEQDDADAENESEEDSETEASDELDSGDESDSENQLAVSDSNQTDDTQEQTNGAGKRPKRLFGWRKPRVSKKNKN